MAEKAFEGTIPLIDPKKGYDTYVRTGKVHVPGINYTKGADPRFWGYAPLDAYWPGKTFKNASGAVTIEEPSLAYQIAESFKNGLHNGSPKNEKGEPVKEPLVIDVGHTSSSKGAKQGACAYILDVLVWDGEIVTYDANGDEIHRAVPEGTVYPMGKLGLLSSGEKIISGQEVVYMSISYTKKDDLVILKQPGLVTNPASDFLPPLVVDSYFSTNEQEEKMDPSKFERVGKDGKPVEKMDANSETYKALLPILQAIFPPESPAAGDICNYLLDAEGAPLLAALSAAKPPAPTQPAGGPPPEVPKTDPITPTKTEPPKEGYMTKEEAQAMIQTAVSAIQQAKSNSGRDAAETAMFMMNKSNADIEKELAENGKHYEKMTAEEAKQAVKMKFGNQNKPSGSILEKQGTGGTEKSEGSARSLLRDGGK